MIKICLNRKDIDKIEEFIGVQDIVDTGYIVHKYDLDCSIEDYEKSLQKLYDILRDSKEDSNQKSSVEIELIFDKDDAKKIAQFIGEQDIEDTRYVVDRYESDYSSDAYMVDKSELNYSAEDYDESLQNLYDMLSSKLGLR